MRKKTEVMYACDPDKNYICSKGGSCQFWCYFTQHEEFMKEGTKPFVASDKDKMSALMEDYIQGIKKEDK